MREPDLVRDVREATRCSSTKDDVKCHMTVGHKGEHAGVSKKLQLILWPNDGSQEKHAL